MSHTYVITGANRGIGLEFCRQLSARGDHVIATTRTESEELGSLGVQVEELDVADPQSIRALAERLDGKAVDVLLNNAGIGGHGPSIGEIEPQALLDFFRVNSVGPLLVTQALLSQLERGARRLVVSVTSRMGSIADNTSGGAYGYRASKAALNMYNASMSVDLAERGIATVVVHPGWVQTDMGGNSAPLTTAESVAGLLRVLDRLGSSDSGRFLDHSGNEIPW